MRLLFVGGPWAGKVHEIPDDRMEWTVGEVIDPDVLWSEFCRTPAAPTQAKHHHYRRVPWQEGNLTVDLMVSQDVKFILRELIRGYTANGN